MNRERVDRLTFIILNHVVSMFGLRIRNDELVYIYRIPKDGCKNIYAIDRTLTKGNSHIIPITSDLTEVFRFVNLDRNRYEKGFDSMFDYASWIMDNCNYFTRMVVHSLEHGIKEQTNPDVGLRDDIRKFLSHVKLSHEEIQDNDLFPATLYYNIKEDIVRNFFYSEELEKRFKEYKKIALFKNELQDKLTGEKVEMWIPSINSDVNYLNLIVSSFIKYVTDGHVENFPDYLVDNEATEVRRDVVWFYEDVFKNSKEYAEFMDIK